jgi:hypothetical protein
MLSNKVFPPGKTGATYNSLQFSNYSSPNFVMISNKNRPIVFKLSDPTSLCGLSNDTLSSTGSDYIPSSASIDTTIYDTVLSVTINPTNFSTGLFTAYIGVPYCDYLTDLAEPASLQNYLNIFPNPASASFTIDLSHAFERNIELKMYDITGHEVFSEHLSTASETISTESLSNGIYLVQLRNSNRILGQQRIIISH